MKISAYYIFLAIIFVLALGCVLVSIFLILGSGFMFFDIDYNEEQRQTAELYSQLITVSGLIGLFCSFILMGNSDRISLYMMKLAGIKLTEEDLDKIDERSRNIL